MDICKFLEDHQIAYQRFDHPAVFTCEEAERLCPDMPGQATKNLFLRDSNGKRHFLVVVAEDKSVDLERLKETLETSKLSFASPERLQKYLGVMPGAVSLLGLVNDSEGNVEVAIDTRIWDQTLQCHPLVNTVTLVISPKGIKEFLASTNHEAKIVTIPERK